MKIQKYIAAFLCISFLVARADDKAATASKDTDFRCEKMLLAQLKEFKEKMLQNCDLDKPFSTSFSRQMNEESYLYCCHTKAH